MLELKHENFVLDVYFASWYTLITVISNNALLKLSGFALALAATSASAVTMMINPVVTGNVASGTISNPDLFGGPAKNQTITLTESGNSQFLAGATGSEPNGIRFREGQTSVFTIDSGLTSEFSGLADVEIVFDNLQAGSAVGNFTLTFWSGTTLNNAPFIITGPSPNWFGSGPGTLAPAVIGGNNYASSTGGGQQQQGGTITFPSISTTNAGGFATYANGPVKSIRWDLLDENDGSNATAALLFRATVVPEPSRAVLLASAFGALLLVRRRV